MRNRRPRRRPQPTSEPGPAAITPPLRARGQALKQSATQRAGRWLQRLGLLVLLAAGLLSAVNILSLNPDVQVVRLGASPSALLADNDTYRTAANHLLSQSAWNRNKITADNGAISRQLLKTYPELTLASLKIPLLAHRPVLYLQGAQPALILLNGGGSYVVDTNGRVLSKGLDQAAVTQSKLPTVTDQSGLSLQVSKQALSSANVAFIQQVVAQLAAKKVQVSGLILLPAASELDAQIAGQPYSVKFNLHDANVRQQAGTFLAAIAQLQKQNQVPQHYVDVRVGGRAYYQ